ncbi:unnamed protein product, partial [Mycena citricolor]
VESLTELASASRFQRDCDEVTRMRARLSCAGLTKVMYWRFDQSLCGMLDEPFQRDVTDLENPSLTELCATLTDPDSDSGDEFDPDEDGEFPDDEADDTVFSRMFGPDPPDKSFYHLPPVYSRDIQVLYRANQIV